MKKISRSLWFISLFLLSAPLVKSQDILVVDPAHASLLNDTAQVKMIMVTLHPGDKLPLHSHPVWMAYCLTAGKMAETYQGQTSTFVISPGMHVVGKPMGAHTDENVGTTDINFLLIEINTATH